MSLHNSIYRYVHLNTKSLAWMRIGVGLVLLYDITTRLLFASAFYGEAGIYPLAHWIKNEPWYKLISLHHWFSFHSLILMVHLAAAFLLALGYKVRITSAICWLLLVSSQNRNPLLLQGGDDLLRIILLWGMLLPWGRHLRIDGVKSENQIIEGWVAWGFVIQVLSVYFFSALLKGKEWHQTGEALSYIYQLDSITYPYFRSVVAYTNILQYASSLVFHLEWMIPMLLLCFFRYWRLRMLLLTILFLFHVFNALTLRIGIFPFIGMVSLIGLLPQTTVSLLPSFRIPRNTQLIAFTFMLYSFFFNLAGVLKNALYVPNWLIIPGYALRLDQSWGMFAPSVLKEDVRFVLVSKSFDHLHHIPLDSVTQPVGDLPSLFHQDRWRKFGEYASQPLYWYVHKPLCNNLVVLCGAQLEDTVMLYAVKKINHISGTPVQIYDLELARYIKAEYPAILHQK